MIRSRLTLANPLGVTIRPPFDERANAARARSISGTSRTLIGTTSIPSDGATAWITPNWAGPVGMVGSRRTATRVTLGAICLSSSSHFPAHAVFPIHETGGVAARPRQTLDEAGADRIGDDREHDRHRAGSLQQRPQGRGAMGKNDVRRERG